MHQQQQHTYPYKAFVSTNTPIYFMSYSRLIQFELSAYGSAVHARCHSGCERVRDEVTAVVSQTATLCLRFNFSVFLTSVSRCETQSSCHSKCADFQMTLTVNVFFPIPATQMATTAIDCRVFFKETHLIEISFNLCFSYFSLSNTKRVKKRHLQENGQ